MPFEEGIYTNLYAKFHSCGKCGKKFEEGEKIWRRYRAGRHKLPGGLEMYLCDECYEGLFVDV